jgi:hypothetical protein
MENAMLRRALLPVAALALSGLVAPQASAQSSDPSFRVVNNTPDVVNEVYASPSTEQSWGQDRLGAEVIAPDGSHIVRLPVGECVYDVRVVYQGGRAEERRGVNTCAITDFVLGAAAAPPQQQLRPQQQQAQPGGANPSFNLVNQSGRVIEQFYASPSSQQEWGPDRLGADTVGPGQRYAIRLPLGECQYDLRVVFQGGQSSERRGVNACSVTDYVVR